MPIAIPKPSPWGEKVLPPTWKRSVWQDSVAGDPLLTHRRDDPLPESAEVVIIGSGLSGTTTAYHLLQSPSRPASIVVLEARETCSGASGRNAGHCRPDAFRGFKLYSELHGKAEAGKMMTSEVTNLHRLAALVEKENIECELTLRPTLDVILSEGFKRYIDESYAGAKAEGVDVSQVTILGREEAREMSRCPEALGAYQWPAASINPLQLALGLHRVNFTKPGYQLFTYTPVTSVEAAPPPSAEGRWLVKTPRGEIVADKVVYASNGYTKLVMPEMDGLITPIGIQAHKVTAPPAGPDKCPKVVPTLSLRYDLNRFYSVAQRPDSSIVVGTTMTFPGQTSEQYDALWDHMDDSAPVEPVAKDTMEMWVKSMPDGGYEAVPQEDGGEGVQDGKGGFEKGWLGIVAMTPDKAPFVGAIPGKDGQYIIAGMNAHGMARIFHSAPCLASLMLGGEWDPAVPLAFRCTEERLARLKKKATEGGSRMKI